MGGALHRLRRAAGNLRSNPRAFARRVLAWARAAVALRGCTRGRSVCTYGRVRVTNRGRIEIGDRVTFVEGVIASELVCHEGALLSIGEETTLNYAASIEASAEVRIGRRCMLASFVRLGDRDRTRVAPIAVGDDVWLAHGVVVEPGVTIGSGSVVAAGSVVTSDVPPGSLASGNPARSMPLALSGAKS